MTSDEMRDVATQLSAVADAFNVRLKAEAKNLTQGEIMARLQEDQRLRSLSNQLYFEAADLDLSSVANDVAGLGDAVERAKDVLANIQQWQDALELMADILVLAGALAAEKPGPIVSAFKEVQADLAKNAGTS
jgi:hypothetical protein